MPPASHPLRGAAPAVRRGGAGRAARSVAAVPAGGRRGRSARSTRPGIDAAQIELDRLAGLLPFRPGGPRAWATALAELLGARCGFHGTPRRLPAAGVLAAARGAAAQARAADPAVGGVDGGRAAGGGAGVRGGAAGALRGRVRRPAQDQVLADPFDGGRVLTGADAELLVAGATGAPLDAGDAAARPIRWTSCCGS